MLPDDLYEKMLEDGEMWFVYAKGMALPLNDASLMDT